MTTTTHELWTFFAERITDRLDNEDDPEFWKVALNTILVESEVEVAGYCGKECVIAEIGSCSHWIRPHWKTRAGTAWPFGYGNRGQGFSFSSLPEFDWSLKWMREASTGLWQPVDGQPTRRPLIQRITIPAHTRRHPQATVHTLWNPGSPSNPKRKITMVYGFEKTTQGWECFTRMDRPSDSESDGTDKKTGTSNPERRVNDSRS